MNHVRRAACMIAVLALAAPCFSQSPISDARKAFLAGRYSAAASGYGQVTRSAASASQAEEAGYMLGVSLLRSGSWSDSIAAFASFRSRYPGSRFRTRVSYWTAEAVFRLAGSEYRAGRFAASRDLYGRVILDSPLSPRVPDAIFFLAESETALGNGEEAGRRYRTLLTLYPDSAYRETAMLRIAETAWRQGDTARALALLDDKRLSFPGSPRRGTALRMRGDIRLQQREYERAAADYTDALAAMTDGPQERTAWYSRGLAELGLGRTEDAQRSFGHAADGPPDALAEAAGWQRAVLLARGGDRGEAEQALEDFIARFPSSPRRELATLIAADLLERSGDTRAAVKQWDALVSFPGSAEYLFRRGIAFIALGRTSEALDDFQRLVRSFPGSPRSAEASYSIGYLYTLRGEYPRALPYFQAAARTAQAGEQAERSLFSASLCLFNMGSFEKAAAALQDLRDRRPSSIPEGTVVLFIGRALYRLGKLDAAAQRFAEAAAAGAGADASYWRAWALLRLGRVDEAGDAFLALARGYPDDARRAEGFFRAGVCKTMLKNDLPAVGLFDEAAAAARAGSDGDIREQAMYQKGWALSRLGRSAESAEAFDALARDYPAGRLAAEAYFKEADRALQDGRFEDARRGFDRVARDFPRGPLAASALYWSAEATRRSGDARASLDGFWACLAAEPGQGIMFSALDGYHGAVLAVGDPGVAQGYALKAKAARGLPGEVGAALQLDYAQLLLASSPAQARSVIREVQAGAPPEPVAGEAALLWGMCDAAEGSWGRAIEVFEALERSRADAVSARAVLQHGAALEAMGRTAEAVDQYLKVPWRFPELSDLGAEGLFDAIRLARARGDYPRAAALEQGLRARYPASSWVWRLQRP
jgi:TolA-binding protein